MSKKEILEILPYEKAICMLTMQRLATLKYRIEHYPNYDTSYVATAEECQKFVEECDKDDR